MFFTAFKRPPNVVSRNGKPSMTLQQYRDEADVNHLIQRFQRTGQFYDAMTTAQRVKRLPQFGDFSELGDFHAQQNHIVQVYEAFNGMPSKVREAFKHNAAAFVEFVGNPDNFDKCVKMGIFSKDDVTKPVEKPVESVVPVTPVEGVNEPVNPVAPQSAQ